MSENVPFARATHVIKCLLHVLNKFDLRNIHIFMAKDAQTSNKIPYRTKFRRTKVPKIWPAAENFVRRKILSAENFVRRNILSAEIQSTSK